jgi:hypothetical protein
MVQGFACLAGGTEYLGTLSQVLIVLFCDFVLSLGEFHFTKVYGLVSAVNEQVYLCSFAFPPTYIALHTKNSQFLFYLSDMVQAQLLKGITAPRSARRRVNHILPMVFILTSVTFDIAQMEQGKQVC